MNPPDADFRGVGARRLVWALLAANALVFLGLRILLTVQGGGEARAFQMAVVWGLSLHEFWDYARVWQPFTALFFHYEVVPFLFWMITLWFLGSALESSLGSLRFGLLYLVAGLFGQFVFLLVSTQVPEFEREPFYGAAPAVYGLLGALAACYPRGRLLLFFIPVPAWAAAVLVALASIAFYGFGAMPLAVTTALVLSLGLGALYTRFGLGVDFGGGDRGADALRGPHTAPPGLRAPWLKAPADGERGLVQELRSAASKNPDWNAGSGMTEREARRIAMEQARSSTTPAGPSSGSAADSAGDASPYRDSPASSSPAAPSSNSSSAASQNEGASRQSASSEPGSSEAPAKPSDSAGSSGRLRFDPRTGKFFSE